MIKVNIYGTDEGPVDELFFKDSEGDTVRISTSGAYFYMSSTFLKSDLPKVIKLLQAAEALEWSN